MTVAVESRAADPFGALADRVRELEERVRTLTALAPGGAADGAVVRGGFNLDHFWTALGIVNTVKSPEIRGIVTVTMCQRQLQELRKRNL